MDLQESKQQHQLINLIDFAISQRRFKKVVQLIDNYNSLYNQSKKMFLLRAAANSELGKPQQCLKDLENCTRLGAQISQISILKIRSHIELNQIKQAQKAMQSLINENQQLKKILQLKKAIQLIKDEFLNHRIGQQQTKILQSMNAWLTKAGATYPKLKIANLSQGYRGAIAIQHIKKRQPIVYIPKSQLITLQMAKNSKLICPLIQKKVKFQSPKHTYLSLFLLELKNSPSTKFKPYIDFLPQNHSCFPINYSKQQLQLLQGSAFLNMIYQKVIDLKKDYQMMIKCEPTLQKFTFKQFCWARMMIGSRIFGLNITGIKTQVLVPFADMLNHRQPKQTIWNYQQSINGFVIQSLQDIEVGQQVFDSYGRKCNSRFLLNYGFVLQQNPDNQISLRIEIQNSDPLSKIKKQMMKQDVNQIFTEVKKINLNLNNNKFYELMGSLRFICVNQQQTLNMLKRISNIGTSNQPYALIRTPPISIKNEMLVWQKLGNICKQNLSKYPNSISEDKKLLQRSDLTQNQKNIITLRMGQKHILHQYQKISLEVLAILKSDNIIQALQAKITKIYARYLYRILCLTPGMNKKNLQKKIGSYFLVQNEQTILQQTQEIAQN